MTLRSETSTLTPPTRVPLRQQKARVAAALSDIYGIHATDTNMMVVPRPDDEIIRRYLEKIVATAWPSADQRLEIDIHRTELNAIDQLVDTLPDVGDSEGPTALVEDIKRLTEAYFTLQLTRPERRAAVQLSFIDSDMCRLFHADHVELRLLCTYLGKGTEWLRDEDANRAGLGKGCNDRIIAGEIQHLDTFDVGLLKGSRYPGNEDRGVVHRSPPIVGSTTPWRVMLKIDGCDS